VLAFECEVRIAASERLQGACDKSNRTSKGQNKVRLVVSHQ